MAISKRTRYEILRRDNNACRYCGSMAPDVKLTVDHVMTVALGGSDKPDNLVAACVDCNAGKSSTAPDAPLVADVSEHANRWRAAMERAAEIERILTDDEQHVLEVFTDKWSEWTTHGGTRLIPMSDNWKETVLNYWRSGLPESEIVRAVEVAMENKPLNADMIYRYFCGVARNKVKSLSERAAQLIESGEV